MSGGQTDSIVEFFESEAEDSLRVVVSYDENTHDFRYIRNDIQNEYTKREFNKHVDTFRDTENVDQSLESALSVGKHHCSIHLFDEMILFNFTQGDKMGTVVSLDPQAGRDLLQFVTQSLKTFYQEDSKRIKSAPEWTR
jgi:hypothetical protein